jgi:Uma2 family endonuclease
VPQSILHGDAVVHLRQVLTTWAERSGQPLRIVHDLAVRWLKEYPRTGIDPDVCVLSPPPPGADDLESLRLWQEGHHAPPLCFEIVSANHPHKDYVDIQDRYADMGTHEFVVFDPMLAGPKALGGPVLLQVWRRDATGVLERAHFGNEPAFCEFLGAWLQPQGRLLQISDDRAGQRIWLSGEERERAEKERERAEKERERAEKERERAEKERALAEREQERVEKERERAARESLERRVAELEAKSGR